MMGNTMPPRCLLVCALAAALAGAETAPPARISLEQALALAASLNETTEVALARIQHALAARRQSLALLLPSLSVSASTSRNSLGGTPYGGRPTASSSTGVDLNLTLFNAGSIANLRAAGVSAAAQQLDSAELRRTLAFQVATSYLQTLASEAQLQAAQRRVEVAGQTAAQTRTRVQAGTATGNDATRSDLELGAAKLTLTNNRQAVLAARLSLGDLVGRAVEEVLDPPPEAVLPGRDQAQLEALALAERSDLQASALRLRATVLQITGTRLELVPRLGAFGSWQVRDSDPSAPVKNSPTWSVGLTATWDLYDGGNREATAEALDGSRREAVANLNAARRGLHKELATALGALATAEESLAQAQAQRQVATLNLGEVQARFREGLATALQAADASSLLFQAETDLVGRTLDLATARFQLRQILGRWPLGDRDPLLMGGMAATQR